MKLELESAFTLADRVCWEDMMGDNHAGNIYKIRWNKHCRDFEYLVEEDDEARTWVTERDLEKV